MVSSGQNNKRLSEHSYMPATKKEIRFEVKEAREISDAEVETLASLLFRWWRRELEQRGEEVNGKGNQKK